MKTKISILLLIFTLCTQASIKAQISLPYYQDFNHVEDTTYTPDELVLESLVGLEDWSYEYAPIGQGALAIGSIDGNSTNTMILTRRIDAVAVNQVILTMDLSLYSVMSNHLLLDFRFSHENAFYSVSNNKIFVRGNETNDWIKLYDWYSNRGSNNEWVAAVGLHISDSLAAYGQDFSETFQLRIAESNFNIDNYFAIDDIKIYASPNSSEGRSGAISPSNGTLAYFGLGENTTETFNDFWTSDDQGDITIQLADFPGVARASAVSFMIDDQVYVGSGEDADGNYLSDFYRYDPDTDSWTQIADFGGGARSHTVAFAIDGYGYVGTGINDTDEQSDFWKYDPESDTWTELSDWGADERQQAFAFVIDDQAYIGGGFNLGEFSFTQLSDIQQYDPETDTWTNRVFADGLNLGMNNAAAFSLYGYGYIAYGNQDHVIKYDPRTDERENLGDYFDWGASRSGVSAYVLGDSAYVGLGRSGSYPTAFEIFYEENSLPTDLSISNSVIDENKPVGTLVGILSSLDEDENESENPVDIFNTTSELSSWNIYPNPFTNTLHLDSREESTLEIFTLLGNNVISQQINNEAQTIDTSDLESGMYIIRLFSKEATRDIKLVKE